MTHVASLSDHCGIKLRLKLSIDKGALPNFTRSTYWKLNSAILDDKEFLPSFSLFWDKILKYRSDFLDIAEWWVFLPFLTLTSALY